MALEAANYRRQQDGEEYEELEQIRWVVSLTTRDAYDCADDTRILQP